MRLIELLEKPVVHVTSGRILGRVVKAHLDEGALRLCGITLQDEGWGKRQRYLAFEELVLIGQVSVLALPRAHPRPARGIALTGSRVLSMNGQLLGWVQDFAFDPRYGAVQALKVSRGVLDDLIRGRQWVYEFSTLPRPDGLCVLAAEPPDKSAETGKEVNPDEA